MAGLERAGNRTVYALRQDAKVVGPSVLLAEEEGNSVQADVDHSRGSLSSSVRKLSLVDGGTINDESLGPCLSRRLKGKAPNKPTTSHMCYMLLPIRTYTRMIINSSVFFWADTSTIT